MTLKKENIENVEVFFPLYQMRTSSNQFTRKYSSNVEIQEQRKQNELEKDKIINEMSISVDRLGMISEEIGNSLSESKQDLETLDSDMTQTHGEIKSSIKKQEKFMNSNNNGYRCSPYVCILVLVIVIVVLLLILLI